MHSFGLVLLVLLSFVTVQAAALPGKHQHSDGSSQSHSHCCPACHAGQLPVVLETAVALATPVTGAWWTRPLETPKASSVLAAANSSRAPPA